MKELARYFDLDEIKWEEPFAFLRYPLIDKFLASFLLFYIRKTFNFELKTLFCEGYKDMDFFISKHKQSLKNIFHSTIFSAIIVKKWINILTNNNQEILHKINNEINLIKRIYLYTILPQKIFDEEICRLFLKKRIITTIDESASKEEILQYIKTAYKYPNDVNRFIKYSAVITKNKRFFSKYFNCFKRFDYEYWDGYTPLNNIVFGFLEEINEYIYFVVKNKLDYSISNFDYFLNTNIFSIDQILYSYNKKETLKNVEYEKRFLKRALQPSPLLNLILFKG